MQQQNFSRNQRQRQRPLQKSMFLTTTEQYSTRNNSVQYQYQGLLEMKRSSIINQQVQKVNNFQLNNNSYQNQNSQINQGFNTNNQHVNQTNSNNSSGSNSMNNITNGHNLHSNNNQISGQQQNQPQILNFNHTPRHKDNFNNNNKLGSLQFNSMFGNPNINNPNNQNNSLQQISIKQLMQKIQKIHITVQNHDQMLKNLSSSSNKQKSLTLIPHNQSQQHNLNEIENKLKQQIIPNLIHQSTKQIYEHLFNSKFQIQTLKQQIQSINQKYKYQINSWIKQNNLSKSGSSSTSTLTLNNSEIDCGSMEMLNSQIQRMESKLTEMQKTIVNKDEHLRNFIQLQIQRNIKKQSHQRSIQSSNIHSSLSPILLQYQQYFVIKPSNTPTSSSKINIIRNSSQRNINNGTQILINSCVYQIDKQGNLLDNQNRYIVDQKGSQIKLDQKHIALLKEHKIL